MTCDVFFKGLRERATLGLGPLNEWVWAHPSLPHALACRRKGSLVNLAGTPMSALAGSRSGRPAAPQAGNASAAAAAAAAAAQPPRFQPLDPDCFLFARKFAPDALQWLLVLARDCEHGSGIDQSCLAGPAASVS